MANREVYAALPLDQRLARLARTPDDLAAAIHGFSDVELARRPDPKNWSPTEIVCHLRDIEEIWVLQSFVWVGEGRYDGAESVRKEAWRQCATPNCTGSCWAWHRRGR
jgi:hypothetical protein